VFPVPRLKQMVWARLARGLDKVDVLVGGDNRRTKSVLLPLRDLF
jgi:hypothetical protein